MIAAEAKRKARSLKNLKKLKIQKKEIELENPIKTVGSHFVNVKLGQDQESRIKIKVQSEK